MGLLPEANAIIEGLMKKKKNQTQVKVIGGRETNLKPAPRV